MRRDGSAAAEELLAHLEARLGRLDESRSVGESDLAGEDLRGFAIVALGREAESFFATFGISRHRLGEDGAVALELVLAATEVDYAADVLTTVGRHVLEKHTLVPAGQRHRLPRRDERSTIGGVMALPDPDVEPFAAAVPPVQFVRLLPITDQEAAHARGRGWRELARALTSEGVDLRDLYRASVA